jgi:catechol 2,3-dioxygenase-like lactoylglutathione lyase family enzyme
MKLDHATIVTPHLDTVRHFFCDIVGLTDGARPPFTFDGHWLYHEGKPVVHLIKSNSSHPPARISSRIDHFAFRVEDEAEWNRLIARLQAAGIVYRSSEVPATGERQLFVEPTPGVAIEFVAAPPMSS